MEDERTTVTLDAQLEHLAEHEPMVASFRLLVDAAIDPGGDLPPRSLARRSSAPAPRRHRRICRRRRPRSARASCSCTPARTFAQNVPCASIAGQLVEVFDGETATSGGSSETDMNEPQTRPLGAAGSPPVTITTPVGRRPSTWRKFWESGRVRSERSAISAGYPRFRRTSSGAWSEGFWPLRKLRSIPHSVSAGASDSLTSARSIRSPRFL